MFTGIVNFLRKSEPSERPYRLLIIATGIACLTLFLSLALLLWLVLARL